MWLTDLLRTSPKVERPTLERWRSKGLAAAEADEARQRNELATLEASYAQLGNQHDYDADEKRETLRPLVSAGRLRLADLQHVVAALREAETLANELLPIWHEKHPALVAAVEAIKTSTAVPDRPTMLALWMASRELESLRRSLYEVTRASEFARPFDALDKVKEHWHLQHQERERVWTHHLSMPHRPTPPTPDWLPKAQRMTLLHDATKGAFA